MTDEKMRKDFFDKMRDEDKQIKQIIIDYIENCLKRDLDDDMIISNLRSRRLFVTLTDLEMFKVMIKDN